MDIARHISYWHEGSREDMGAAIVLLERGKPRHALFFAHLSLEKLLKALVAKATQDLPPRIHDLLRLAEMACLALTRERREFLARFQRHCLEGRYPDTPPTPSRSLQETQVELDAAKEALAWLTSLLR